MKERLPDFIIVGAMKCATSSLHDQLSEQSGIHMSTPKEPNFFSDDEIFAKGMSWYQDLFSPDSNIINGESSTHYMKYPDLPSTWDRMKSSGIDKQKFIYVVRDPIDRLVSHYIHQWSQGVIKCDIDHALDKHSELIDYSRYSMQLERAFKYFPKSQFLVVFSERFKSNAQMELENICEFIGYEGQPVWDAGLSSSNISSKRVKKFPFYDFLIESSLMTFLRRSFFPKSVRRKIRESLTMKKRPQLSPDSMHQLNQIFDRDLRELGSMINLDITIDNYKAVSQKTSPIIPS